MLRYDLPGLAALAVLSRHGLLPTDLMPPVLPVLTEQVDDHTRLLHADPACQLLTVTEAALTVVTPAELPTDVPPLRGAGLGGLEPPGARPDTLLCSCRLSFAAGAFATYLRECAEVVAALALVDELLEHSTQPRSTSASQLGTAVLALAALDAEESLGSCDPALDALLAARRAELAGRVPTWRAELLAAEAEAFGVPSELLQAAAALLQAMLGALRAPGRERVRVLTALNRPAVRMLVDELAPEPVWSRLDMWQQDSWLHAVGQGNLLPLTDPDRVGMSAEQVAGLRGVLERTCELLPGDRAVAVPLDSGVSFAAGESAGRFLPVTSAVARHGVRAVLNTRSGASPVLLLTAPGPVALLLAVRQRGVDLGPWLPTDTLEQLRLAWQLYQGETPQRWDELGGPTAALAAARGMLTPVG